MTTDYVPAQNKLENFNPLGFELQQLQKNITAMQTQLRLPQPDGDLLETALERIENQYKALVTLDEEQHTRFEQERTQLIEHQLPEAIFERQQQFEQSYTQHMDAILSLAEQLQRPQSDDRLQEITASLAAHLQYPVSAPKQSFKIYTLTKDNKGQLANITIDDNARSEISQALSLGLEVTVHERPINVNGWEGSGYSIIDADYGVGAYKISGGSNGGRLVLDTFSSLLNFVNYIRGFLEALNEQLGGSFIPLLEPFGKAIALVNSVASTLKLLDLENCSISDIRDIILMNTLFTVFFIFLSELVLFLALGPIFWFAMLSIIGLLLTAILNNIIKYSSFGVHFTLWTPSPT